MTLNSTKHILLAVLLSQGIVLGAHAKSDMFGQINENFDNSGAFIYLATGDYYSYDYTGIRFGGGLTRPLGIALPSEIEAFYSLQGAMETGGVEVPATVYTDSYTVSLFGFMLQGGVGAAYAVPNTPAKVFGGLDILYENYDFESVDYPAPDGFTNNSQIIKLGGLVNINQYEFRGQFELYSGDRGSESNGITLIASLSSKFSAYLSTTRDQTAIGANFGFR